MSAEIRLLTAADAPLFDHVAEGGFDEPVHKQRLAAYLAEPGHFFIAAIEDGMIVGQCAGARRSPAFPLAGKVSPKATDGGGEEDAMVAGYGRSAFS